MNRFVILSGCSGGGKSTLLSALAAKGYATIEEPGRRIVAEEQAGDGKALPWINLEAFAHRAIALALEDRERAASLPGWVFFDRSLIDAATALKAATGDETQLNALKHHHRYHARVFLTPPWPEIYQQDAERQHDLTAAEEEYQRLCETYPALGYEAMVLPKVSVVERVEFILAMLQHPTEK
ncbi:AAA family ATPase [Agrobacterium vitis]|uniref:AAA family ATPase n=1 Tax=Agrobacterium vitis TaxID=373 RepID=UPI0012E93D6B|nr:AAA family ATPase [Agrobacterium vitis]MVA34319.1 AAA family ATPase [Agrobacterium vitis]MVA80889.1 AAA family ATPase [Agrobacterium vitis]